MTGTVTASSPASLSAQRHMSVDGTVTALSGDLTTGKPAATQRGRERRLQSSGKLDAKAGGDIDSDGTLATGGALALAVAGRLHEAGTIVSAGTSSGHAARARRTQLVRAGQRRPVRVGRA
ncbi:hypothetical protein WJ970_21150 [Achromobacter xylosoxidans]